MTPQGQAALELFGFLAAVVILGGIADWLFRRADQRLAAKNARIDALINGETLRQSLTAEAERLFPGTDSDRFDGDCNDPPCSQEDGWVCSWHLHQVRQGFERAFPGRHRLGNTPLDDMPGHVITEVAASVRRRQR